MLQIGIFKLVSTLTIGVIIMLIDVLIQRLKRLIFSQRKGDVIPSIISLLALAIYVHFKDEYGNFDLRMNVHSKALNY